MFGRQHTHVGVDGAGARTETAATRQRMSAGFPLPNTSGRLAWPQADRPRADATNQREFSAPREHQGQTYACTRAPIFARERTTLRRKDSKRVDDQPRRRTAHVMRSKCRATTEKRAVPVTHAPPDVKAKRFPNSSRNRLTSRPEGVLEAGPIGYCQARAFVFKTIAEVACMV